MKIIVPQNSIFSSLVDALIEVSYDYKKLNAIHCNVNAQMKLN